MGFFNKHNFESTEPIRKALRLMQHALGLSLLLGINLLAKEFPLKKDLTRSKQYSLNPITQAYLKQMKEEIEFIVTLSPQSEQGNEALQIEKDLRHLLGEYQVANWGSHVPPKINFLKAFQERQEAALLEERFGSGIENSLIIASANRYKVIPFMDLYEIEEAKLSAFLGERVVTQALLEVCQKEPYTVYFITGHGEMEIDSSDHARGLSKLKAMLHKRSIQAKAISLQQLDALPSGSHTFVISSPQVLFQTNEVLQLAHQLDTQGGSLICLLDPLKPSGLEDLLEEWGLETPTYILEESSEAHQTASGDLILSDFPAHPATQTLNRYGLPIVWGLSRPLALAQPSDSEDELELTALVISSDTSHSCSVYRDGPQLRFDRQAGTKGPFALAGLSEQHNENALGLRLPAARVIVFGNADFISNARIGAYANGLLMADTLQYCFDNGGSLDIPSRQIESLSLSMSQNHFHELALSYLIGPLILALMGLCVAWIR